MNVPGSLKETLEPSVLAHIESALGPPLELRANKDFEVEIECAGEGTFVLALTQKRLTAKKGFARKPLVSFQIPKGGWVLLRGQLQEALDGFAKAPELRASMDKLRAPRAGDLDAVVQALERLPDVCVRFDVKGRGVFSASRGPADEAGHVVTVALDGAALDAVLAGAPPQKLEVKTTGDRGILPAVLAAFAPLTALLKSR